MVTEVRKLSLREKFKKLSRSPFFIPVTVALLVIISIIVAYFLLSKQQEIRSRAAGSPTATIQATPASGTFSVGQQFTVNVVINGGGQTFNAAESAVTVSSNLTVQSLSLVSPSSGGCNFTFVNQASTPSVANPSFAGAILNGSASQCTLYTLTLQANALGTGTITFANSSVKAYVDASEILSSVTNGSYSISSLTPVPTTSPTPTPIPPNSDLTFLPVTQQVTNGATFSIQIRVNTNGQFVNAFQTDVSYPSNLLNLVSISNTGADFTAFEDPNVTPPPGSFSLISGSTTPKSGDLLIRTITFSAKATGTATVQFINPILASSITNTDVLKSFTNGVYTITTAVPTPTSTPVPTATSAPTPTATATPIPSVIPPTPTPTPTGVVTVQPPLIDPVAPATYNTAFTMTGTKLTTVTSVLVNGSATGVTLPTSTTWRFSGTLALGNNNFLVVGKDAAGNSSSPNTLTISLHRLGDINGDNVIDLTDVSIFGTDWKNTGTLNSILSDMNGDAVINLTDFSIIAKAYGN